MSKLRSINTSFWSDPWIETLEPKEKLLFIYLFTNSKTNMLGIYESSARKISFESGVDLNEVESIFDKFQLAGKIKIIGHYVILTNYMKHQNYNPNMKKSAVDTYNSLPINLKVRGLSVCRDNASEGFERLSKAYGTVSKIEVEYESEEELELEEESKAENNKPETSEKEDFSGEFNLDDTNKPLKEKERKKVALKKESINYQEVVEFFNNTCTQLPNVQKLTEKRKKAIRNRIKEYEATKVGEVLIAVSKSSFLNGNSSMGWKANFDWIMKPENFIKILEGQYKNKEVQTKQDAKIEAQKAAYLANSNPNDLM